MKDCDGCEAGCTHEEHGVRLRAGGWLEHSEATNHLRVRDAREIRVQTDCRVQLPTLTYSTVYGNKIRKLWKMLAKADLLPSDSYEFKTPLLCKELELFVY